MKKFKIETENGDYEAYQPNEKDEWRLSVNYRDSKVAGNFFLPANWGELRVMQLIADLDKCTAT